MKNPLISVIIPVYNRAATIETCVKGIYNTSATNFEVIIVNDGSSDDSLEICNRLSKQYSSLKVLSQDNSGVSVARNNGVANALGKYIMFVDSDDTLPPDTITRATECLNKDYDIVFWGHNTCSFKKCMIAFNENNTLIQKEIIGNKNIIKWVFGEDFNPYINSFYSVWAKAFKRDIILNNNITYRKDVSLGEDQIFVCEYLKFTNTLFYDNRSFYTSISWPKSKKKLSLGGMMRTPEDFIYNQIANYDALNSLYHASGIEEVKVYAVNYILDRPITRIIFRNTSLMNKHTANYGELKRFTKEQIKGVLIKEAANITMLKDKSIVLYNKLIINNFPFIIIYILVFIQENSLEFFKKVFRKIKHKYLGI